METYHSSLISVPAPLVVFQGIANELRPQEPKRRVRVLKEQAYVAPEKKQNYGVQLEIDRELDDLKNNCIERLVNMIEKCNVNNRLWWPSQDNGGQSSQKTQQPQKLEKSSLKQKQQLQLSRQRLLSSLSSGSTNSKGLWFNIQYADDKYDIVVNGTKSPLSPYNKDGSFYGSLLPVQWADKYYNYIPSVFITFYEIGADKRWDDLLINEVNRVKLKFSNTMIKFVCILINMHASTIDTERIQSIVSRINMNPNSLFVINGASDEISKREQTVFIRKLMIGLRQYSNDFFNLQIQKLKKREIKNDQYSEKFFSARNLIKMAMFEQLKGITDYSTKLLEYAYDRLLQSLRSIDPVSQPNQDAEARIWLDIMCIHIVRSCIVLGDANIAYRKFTFHVQQIRELDGDNFTFDWLATQYTWLGELLENVNESIIPIDPIMMPTLGLKEIRYNSYNIPQNGFNFLQAAEYRGLAIQYEDRHGPDNTVLLLTAALDSFNLAKSGKFSRIESRVYILLGDVYYAKQNYSMAVNNYFAGLSNYRQESWMFIVGCVLQKILQCYVGLSQIREAWAVYLELCCIDDLVWKRAGVLESTKTFLDIMKEKIISLDLVFDDSQSILMDDARNSEDTNSEVLGTNSNGGVPYVKEGVFEFDVGIKQYTNMMNEGVDLQLLIRHKGDKMISTLEINHFEIDMGENSEFKVIKVTNSSEKYDASNERNGDDKKPIVLYQLNCDSKEISEEVKCPLEFKTIDGKINRKCIILQLHVLSSNVGKFYVPRVRVNGTLNDVQFTTVINIAGLDSKSRPFLKWYVKDSNPITLSSHYPTNSFEVLPKIPEIKCNLKYDRVGFNGRLFPVLLKFFNEDTDSGVKIHIRGMGVLNKKYDVAVKWGNNNDAERFDSDSILKPGDGLTAKCVLELPQVGGLPLSTIDGESTGDDDISNCIIKFNINYELIDDGVSIDVKKEARVKIVEMIEWHTELRADQNGKFPNLFVIDQKNMLDVGANMNIPVHTRKWLFTLNLRNVSFEDMNITSCKFVVRGPKGVTLTLTPEVEDNEEDSTTLTSMGEKKFRVWLDVVCYERIIRSVPVDVQCEIEYYINQMKDVVQHYRLEMYKANLPHVDPRMLVVVKDGNSPNEIMITYILENPTDRIFQYQTNLNPVSGVEIVDYVKSMQLSVMPFMQEKIEFVYRVDGKSLEGRTEIVLPEFTLYDRQFQVFVKPNVADDRLKCVEGHLYLKDLPKKEE